MLDYPLRVLLANNEADLDVTWIILVDCASRLDESDVLLPLTTATRCWGGKWDCQSTEAASPEDSTPQHFDQLALGGGA